MLTTRHHSFSSPLFRKNAPFYSSIIYMYFLLLSQLMYAFIIRNVSK
ncbi:hypothetical protein EMIT079MI2_40298 [Bacillus sp. IT-79MI2]